MRVKLLNAFILLGEHKRKLFVICVTVLQSFSYDLLLLNFLAIGEDWHAI